MTKAYETRGTVEPDWRTWIGRTQRRSDRVTGAPAAEQSGVTDDSRALLVAGNVEYEERFGHVFLICATGLSGADMLAALRERLKNDPGTERDVTARELLKITVLRARKLAGA